MLLVHLRTNKDFCVYLQSLSFILGYLKDLVVYLLFTNVIILLIYSYAVKASHVNYCSFMKVKNTVICMDTS